MNSETKGAMAIILATFFYGFYGILSRLLYNTLDLFFQFWVRSLLIALLTFFVIIIKKSWKRIDSDSLKWFVLRGIAGAFTYTMFFVAVNHLKIGTTLFIFYAALILGGYAFGLIIFKERLSRNKVMALTLSILGLSLIYSATIGAGEMLYILLALACGLCTSGWNTLSNKVIDKFGLNQIIFIDSSIAGAITLIASLIKKENWELPSLSLPWMYSLLFFGMLWSVSLLIPYGFSKVGAQKGSLLMLMEVVFTLVFAYLFFNETIDLMTITGGTLIIAGIVLSEKNQK